MATRRGKPETPRPVRPSRAKPALNVEKIPAHCLTQIQRDWCRFYVENGGRSYIAARAAGYKNMKSGTENAKNPLCMAEVEKLRAKVQKKFEVTIDRVVEEYSKIAFADLGDLLVEDEDGNYQLEPARMSAGHKAALSDFTAPVKGKDGKMTKGNAKFMSKQAALDALARFLGMNNDKLEVSGTLTMAERIAAGRKRAAIRNTEEPEE